MTIVPRDLRIDASTVCQLRCKTCPTGQHQMPVAGRGFLSFDNFKKLIDDNPRIRNIELSNFGEILLNPQLIDILQYSYDKGVRLYADNGVNFNNASHELLLALVKFKFRSMTCSIDGASQESYQKYRINGSFDNVIKNIKHLQKIKKQCNSRYPVLTWQYVVFGHNEKEIPIARSLAKKMGIGFKVKLNWDESFSPIKDIEFVKKETSLRITSRNDFQHHRKKVYLSSTCHQLWDEPQINWDGKLLGCCWNYWGEFGENVFETSLQESLNDEKLNYAKKMLLGTSSARDDVPCTKCDNYRNMVNTGSYLDRKIDTLIKIMAKKAIKKLLLFIKSFK